MEPTKKKIILNSFDIELLISILHNTYKNKDLSTWANTYGRLVEGGFVKSTGTLLYITVEGQKLCNKIFQAIIE